jgi:integrase/recombinase XerD
MRQSKYTQVKRKLKPRISGFIAYLETKQYSKETIRAESNYIAMYLHWISKEQIRENEVTYNELITYIDELTTEGDSKAIINRKLATIRKYYEYLQYMGSAEKNPAMGLTIHYKRQRIPRNLLTTEELTTLYENYQVNDLRSQRNKVMIGLLVFQGVTREEIEKLEINHVKLNTGKIEIPTGKHGNGRILPLESIQMLDLQEYLHITRPEIQKANGSYGIGRKPDHVNREKARNQLFISMHGSDDIKSTFLHLVYALRKQNPKLTTAVQIRQSVITKWLKTKNLRMVQYMAGHRYVSSTERYQVNNLEDLQHQLEKLHPLNTF